MKNSSFEELMNQLEHLVMSLENGETKLEEALSLYKKGVEIVGILEKRLKDAKKQIKTADGSKQGE